MFGLAGFTEYSTFLLVNHVVQSTGSDIFCLLFRNQQVIPPICIDLLLPIGSMYAIYGNIYHQYTPNVSIYTYIYIPYMDIIRWLVVIVNFCIRRFDSFPYNEPLTPKSWDDSSDHIYAWIQWGQNVCSFAKNTSSWQGWACRACHSLWNKDLPICHISPNRWGRVLWNLVSTPWIDSAHQWRCYERIALSGFGSRLRLAFGWPKCQGRQLPAHQALEGWTLWSVQGCSPGRWLGLVVSNEPWVRVAATYSYR